MKKWYKYSLNYKDNTRYFPKDTTFEDHKRSMRGYEPDKGYGSKEEFFKTYFYEAHPRHRHYHDYLKRHLKKGDNILSIGSGRCANELLLIEEGFDITCSDFEQPCREETIALFPGLRFIRYDVTRAPVESKVDSMVSLSMFYLFDADQLAGVFKNISDSLKPGGNFILDPGGAENNLGTRLIDEIICPLEAWLIKILHKILKNKNCVVAKKEQGYRTTDAEIMSIAKKAGFSLYDTEHKDHLTEFGMRSVILGRMPRGVVELFGRAVPHVRMFAFKKER